MDFHRVDLETAAALGCAKCINEYETGTKKRKTHDDNCPRKRPVRSEVHERKRPQETADEEEEDVNINDNAEDDTPSSAPRRIRNNIDFPLTNLHSQLICSLCNGYFRDPHTVAECLHTFCRSCLILFFRQGMRCCPTCNTRLGPDPFHSSISIQSREVMPDRTLQAVVNKIFPWMKIKEEEEERDFYAQRGIELKPEYATQEVKAYTSRGSGKVSVSTVMTDDLLDLKLEPDGQPPKLHQRLPPLHNSLLRTSGRLKIVSIKKYLVQRLGIKESKNSIELLCNGDPMGDELSLTFILRTRWFSTNKVLTLKYRLEEGDAKK